jgi:hypothetical protein
MENFYLESNEEFFSIIDRIKRSRDEDITLAVPSGLSALRSIINLRILKEEAISSGKDISIITSDSLIKKLAQQANIVVLERPVEEPAEKTEPIQAGPPQFEDLGGEDEEKDWPEQLKEGGEIRPRPEVEPVSTDRGEPIRGPEPFFEPIEEGKEEVVEEPVEEKPSVAEAMEGEEEAAYEPKGIKPSFKFFTKKRVIATFVILALIAGGFILYFVLPRAQIIINPKKEAIRFETEIRIDKNINSVNFSDNSVPGQVFQLEMEDSRKFPTTGEKEVEEKARGTIIVYNQYSSEPQTLVKTTRFLSERGKLFRLVETVVIPGATIEEGEIIPSNREVEVIADEAGETYNIDASAFTIPGFEGTAKYDAFYGQSTEPMTGGAKGKMRVATEEDVEGGIEIVSVELKSKVQEQFRKKIPSDLKLLKDTQALEVTESGSTLEADEPGKEFLVTVKAKARALAFKEGDVFHLIEKNIEDKISENKILIPSTIQVSYSNIGTDLAGGRADFSCQVEIEAAWRLDEEKFRNDLAGKDEIEVRKHLSSLSEIEGAKVIFWPFWVKRIPRNKDKIKIIIDTNI